MQDFGLLRANADFSGTEKLCQYEACFYASSESRRPLSECSWQLLAKECVLVNCLWEACPGKVLLGTGLARNVIKEC